MNSFARLLCRRKIPKNNSFFSSNAMKESRADRLRNLNMHQQGKNSSLTPTRLLIGGAIVGVVVCSGTIISYPDGSLGKLYKDSFVSKIVSRIHEETVGRFTDIMEPAQTKLLPDWPTAPCYGNPPPGTPAPPLLVLDLERTLIGSVHDTRYGWRHVKRPGLDRFLNSMLQYYEVVIFSENDVGVVQDTLAHIDPQNAFHKLGSAAGEIKGTTVLKRLDLMNRDLSRIILVDDREDSSELFPRNTLLIKPFDDVNDKSDTALLELIPLLQAFIHDGVTDFRDTIDNLGTHDAAEAVTEYRMRLAERKSREERKRNKGLGGLVRSSLPKNEAPDEFAVSSRILSASQIVGAAPPGAESESSKSVSTHSGTTAPEFKNSYGVTVNDKKGPSVKKKGAVAEWLENAQREKESVEAIKQQKMNELYQQREMEKARIRHEQAEAARASQ